MCLLTGRWAQKYIHTIHYKHYRLFSLGCVCCRLIDRLVSSLGLRASIRLSCDRIWRLSDSTCFSPDFSLTLAFGHTSPAGHVLLPAQNLAGRSCFKPDQPQRILSGLRETSIKRYLVERTNKAETGPEQQSEEAKSCLEILWNEIQSKGPWRPKWTLEQNKKEWASSVWLMSKT